MEWIINNVEWLFSGIGVTIVMGIFVNKKLDSKKYQSITSGDNSTNIQGGKNVNVTIGDNKDA